MFDQVDELKQELDAKRPLPSGMVKNLRKVIRIEWTYNSNAIEGNTLSLLETKVVAYHRRKAVNGTLGGREPRRSD